MKCLRVATWNVHSFSHSRTAGELVACAREAAIDVLLLQECGSRSLETETQGCEARVYAGAPGDWMGNGLVCLTDRVRMLWTRCVSLDVDRSALAALLLVDRTRVVLLYVTHLAHNSENRRVCQVQNLLAAVDKECAGLPAHVDVMICGDLNALTRGDYSESRWERLQRDRAERSWEPCESRVTELLTHSGFRDLSMEPLIWSSRFSTRIDYCFGRGDGLDLQEYRTLSPEAALLSDHKCVYVALRVDALRLDVSALAHSDLWSAIMMRACYAAACGCNVCKISYSDDLLQVTPTDAEEQYDLAYRFFASRPVLFFYWLSKAADQGHAAAVQALEFNAKALSNDDDPALLRAAATNRDRKRALTAVWMLRSRFGGENAETIGRMVWFG